MRNLFQARLLNIFVHFAIYLDFIEPRIECFETLYLRRSRTILATESMNRWLNNCDLFVKTFSMHDFPVWRSICVWHTDWLLSAYNNSNTSRNVKVMFFPLRIIAGVIFFLFTHFERHLWKSAVTQFRRQKRMKISGFVNFHSKSESNIRAEFNSEAKKIVHALVLNRM